MYTFTNVTKAKLPRYSARGETQIPWLQRTCELCALLCVNDTPWESGLVQQEVPGAPPRWESGNYSGSNPGSLSGLELQTSILEGSAEKGLREEILRAFSKKKKKKCILSYELCESEKRKLSVDSGEGEQVDCWWGWEGFEEWGWQMYCSVWKRKDTN